MLIPITPTEVDLAIELAIKAQEAIQEFMVKGMPVLQKASAIIAHMQATGTEIPDTTDRAALKAMGVELDAAAEAAIKAAST